MNSVSLERTAMRRVGVAAAAIGMLAALLLSTTGAEAASPRPFGSNGVINVCFKVRGKDRGAMRIVKHPRRCKRMRGWRRTAWSAIGVPGVNGGPGLQGTDGATERTLIEKVETQSAQIEQLTDQVSSLTGELAGLEGLVGSLVGDVTGLEGGLTILEGDLGGLEGTLSGLSGEVTGLGGEVTGLGETVEGACTQLSLLTDGTDELIGAVGGISLDTLLAVLLEIPPLPATLGEFECG